MGAYAESMWSHANVDVPLAHIKPTGDCVLVRVLPEKEVTASGIVLPQTGKDSSELRFGEVISVGPGDMIRGKRAPMHVKAGDRIWYRRVLANQQMINGELYQLVREEAHIWAVLEQ